LPKERAEVAQSVEQRTENPRVNSSILFLGTSMMGGSGSVVEHLLAKERVASSNLVFRSIFILCAEVAEPVDATVSKTVGGQLPCRFEPDLRQCVMPSSVTVAQETLNLLVQVRTLARQPVE
jgi:hypothetical protein